MNGKQLLAIIIRADFHADGVQFFTDDNMSQQLGYMRHRAGTLIKPHLHNPVARKVDYTQETLFIRHGQVMVNFYDTQKKYLKSRILDTGDVILLVSGAHGFTVMHDSEIIEVKQGPFVGDSDKLKWTPTGNETFHTRE